MPVNLSIKEVPDALAEKLRARAALHHRSLQGELMAIIEQAASEQPAQRAQSPLAASAESTSSGRSIEDIAAAQRAKFPKAIHRGPMAVDIIRADRDSR